MDRTPELPELNQAVLDALVIETANEDSSTKKKGAVLAAITALAVHHYRIPPTINQEHPDPECDLDSVPGESRKMTVRKALNNSFGFGGTNATILLSKHED